MVARRLEFRWELLVNGKRSMTGIPLKAAARIQASETPPDKGLSSINAWPRRMAVLSSLAFLLLQPARAQSQTNPSPTPQSPASEPVAIDNPPDETGFFTSIEVLVAMIAAGASIFISLIALLWHPAEVRIKTLEAALSAQKAENDAQRDYKYEALKRLYEQVEPLLFQLYEAAEGSYERVISLARASQHGNLGSGQQSFVSGEGGHFLHATIYRMLLPAVIFRLIQRRMTFIDLQLDGAIQTKYQLLKLYYLSFTDDFEFTDNRDKYRPNDPKADVLLETDPDVYFRQGVVLGSLDIALDALVVKEGDKSLYPVSYGEFAS